VSVADTDWKKHSDIAALVDGSSGRLRDKLRAVVLHGPAVRGEGRQSRASAAPVMVADIHPETLTAVGPALSKWVSRDLPVPACSPPPARRRRPTSPGRAERPGEKHAVIFGSDPGLDAGDRRRATAPAAASELREKLMRPRRPRPGAAARRRICAGCSLPPTPPSR
jgi:hypothetical protein